MIKQIAKKIIVFAITFEAKLVLKRHKPKIVAITGSVGKTSAKDAVASVLGGKFFVRKSVKSYNGEIGVPLIILGCENAWLNPVLWGLNILKGMKLFLFSKKSEYPKWLILEMGVERPNDMGNLMSWIKPNIVIFTTVAEMPPHVEFFNNSEELAREKMKIISGLTASDYFAFNGDDEALKGIKNKTQAKTISFGFDADNDLIVSNYHLTYRKDSSIEIPEGITFKVDYKGSSVPIRILGSFGKHHVYAVLAGIAAGLTQDFNLVEISEALYRYKSPAGRLKLIDGIKNTLILDDTYNASPMAVRAALDVLNELPATGRKIAALGDMLELGKYTIEAHKAVGAQAAKIANIIFAVGPRAKFIGDEAKSAGFDSGNIFEFSTSIEAGKKLQEVMREGDLILVKGSQSMRMEKIVEEIMLHPELKGQLLVRQEKDWLKK